MSITEIIKGIFRSHGRRKCKTNNYEGICKKYIGIAIVDTPENPFDTFGKREMVALEVSSGYVRYKFRYPMKLDKWLYESMKCSTFAYIIKEGTNETRQ